MSRESLNKLAKELDPKLLRQMIDKESPELQGLLQEF